MEAAAIVAGKWWRPSTRGRRLLLGAVTLWPLLYIGLFITAAVLMIGARAAQPPEGGEPWMIAVLVAHCTTMVLMLATLVLYVVSVVNNPKLDQTIRIVWLLLMFFGGFIAAPVYWWLYLRPE